MATRTSFTGSGTIAATARTCGAAMDGGTAMTTVHVAPGSGRVARRGQGLLFLPLRPSPVSRAFLDAADVRAARAAATSAVIESGFDGDPFAVVTWDDGLHVIVFGDVEVRTDLAELPMVSGAGSTTWVEHRVADHTGVVTLEAGEPAATDTDIAGGIAPAGGFRAAVQVGPHERAARAGRREQAPPPEHRSPGVSAPADSATPATATASHMAPSSDPPAQTDDDEHDEVTIPAPVATDDLGAGPPPGDVPGDQAAPDAEVADPATAAEPPVPHRVAGVAALEAATEGDWMEESLGLGGTSRSAPRAQPAAPSHLVTGAHSPSGGDTTGDVPGPTDGTGDAPVASGTHAPAADAIGGSAPAAGDTPDARAGSDLGERQRMDDAHAPTSHRSTGVASQPCPGGHPNRPGAARCRICSELISPDAPTISVPQPVVGVVALPDGTTSPLDTTLVIGRRPQHEAARVDATARLLELGDSDTVSRTHLVIRPRGWSIEVADCGSTSGTAVVTATDDEPVMLEPWIAHEVGVGTTIYVGGPTKVTLVDTSSATGTPIPPETASASPVQRPSEPLPPPRPLAPPSPPGPTT